MKKRMEIVLAGMLAWGAAAWGAEPVADWTMVHKRNGGVKNLGTAGEAGDLALTTGAVLSDDVPTANTGGTALRLASDGTTAAAESADAFDPLAGAEAFTLMGWVRRDSLSRSVNQSARIYSDVDSSGTVAAGVEFRFAESTGRLALRVNGTEVTATTVGIPPDNGTWQHVAVVFDGRRGATNYASRNVHFYVNGIQKGYGNVLQGLAVASNALPATVGNSSANRTADNMLAGSIDDVLVFSGWAPEPSGNNNLNLSIRDWMVRDDAGVEPDADDDEGGGGGGSGGGDSGEEEEEVNKEIPPATLEDVVVQILGAERQYEPLRKGLIFIDATTGELYYTNEEHPEGRTVCVCKPLPDWHSFSNTVHVNGHVLELNPHYSIQAESHVLSIRYGTNTVWGILGDESGELAGLTAAMVDEGHMTISANVPGGSGAVLMVATNLLESNPWKPATNAIVYSATDQATTWYVTLMEFDGMSGAEFYRVFGNGITRPAGVYCNEPLRANKGVVLPAGESWTMGINTWTNLPNMGEYAKTGSVATVASNLAAHAGNTSNPHGVTLMQAFDEDPDGAYDDFGIGVSGGDGISELHGFAHRIGFEESFVEGEFDFWDRPTFDGNGLATTNEVGAVATRVEDLEATCCLYWPSNFVVSNSVITTNYTVVTNGDAVTTNVDILHTLNINPLVTNCPTRCLELTIYDKGITHLNIKFDPTWTPDSPKEININVVSKSGNPTNRSTRVLLNDTESNYVLIYTAYNNYRDVTLFYDPGSPYYWRVLPRARLYASYWFASESGARVTQPTGQPATVEEWLAARSRARSLDRAAKLALAGPPKEAPLEPAKPGDLGIDDDLTVREGMEATIALTEEEMR